MHYTRDRKNPAVASGLAMAVLVLATFGLAGCGQKDVSYAAQVQPILDKHCAECHAPGGSGYEASGLELTGYSGLMQGTRFGPIVEPGDPLSSVLNQLVEGRADPSISMPHGRDLMAVDEQAVLHQWVAQGALND